jgi:glutathione S-transferase
MYRLYWHPFTASMAPHAALEEIGVPYELVTIDIKNPPPSYLKIQPMGRVPALEHEGGVIFEAGAILLHLADAHPEAKLAPMFATRERALYYQWILFLANTGHPAFKVFNFPHRFAPPGADLEATKAQATKAIDQFFRILDDALDPGPYLLGRRFTIADFYAFAYTKWIEPGMPPLSAFPRVAAYSAHMAERPACRAMLKAHGFA